MQSLFKGTLNGLKLSGLNTHMLVRGFARMTGRNKKTFAQALERTEEVANLYFYSITALGTRRVSNQIGRLETKCQRP